MNEQNNDSEIEGLDQLSTLRVSSIKSALDVAVVNSEVKVRIAHLGEVDIDNVAVEYSAALIEDQVQAHVHMNGPETYIILGGTGLMYIGEVHRHEHKLDVAWEEPVHVRGEDIFTIPPRYAHSLIKTGSTPLFIVFFGSPRNLTIDREIVTNP